jgi:hypothetical protein
MNARQLFPEDRPEIYDSMNTQENREDDIPTELSRQAQRIERARLKAQRNLEGRSGRPGTVSRSQFNTNNLLGQASEGCLATPQYNRSCPKSLNDGECDHEMIHQGSAAISHNNNNNTFTWSGPRGVVDCTGQARVAHLGASV